MRFFTKLDESSGAGDRLGDRDRGDSGEGEVGAVVPVVRVGSASLDTLGCEASVIGEDAVMEPRFGLQ